MLRHNIVRSRCRIHIIPFSVERAEMLTPFATEARDPDEWYFPSAEETQEVLGIAEEIKAFVLA